MRKDKAKVLDDVWTEDHVRSFLSVTSHDGTDNDFHGLLKAYQSMRPSDFELFVSMLQTEKRNLSATNKNGQTVLEIVSEHRHGADYAKILKAAGA